MNNSEFHSFLAANRLSCNPEALSYETFIAFTWKPSKYHSINRRNVLKAIVRAGLGDDRMITTFNLFTVPDHKNHETPWGGDFRPFPQRIGVVVFPLSRLAQHEFEAADVFTIWSHLDHGESRISLSY